MSLGGAATEEDGELVAKLFGSVGRIWRADEKLFDAITGLNGSGPAYIYLAIEALADGGVVAGLPRELALGLASQTKSIVLGAASMAIKSGKHPGQLKDDVYIAWWDYNRWHSRVREEWLSGNVDEFCCCCC
ncbi:hypothetical protein CRYUN_Cryun16bG0070000 [Craigia yunnanensis]